jgi:hypothetical protein
MHAVPMQLWLQPDLGHRDLAQKPREVGRQTFSKWEASETVWVPSVLQIR